MAAHRCDMVQEMMFPVQQPWGQAQHMCEACTSWLQAALPCCNVQRCMHAELGHEQRTASDLPKKCKAVSHFQGVEAALCQSLAIGGPTVLGAMHRVTPGSVEQAC